MRRTSRIAAAWILVACAGCGRVPRYACPDPSRPCDDPVADGSLPPCAGTCISPLPEGWSGPVLLWIGPGDGVPPCPPEAPHREYDGHRGAVFDPAECPACSCSPSSGTCRAPPGVTAHQDTCRPDWAGVPEIPLGPPGDGACASLAVPASCAATPCAASVSVDPLEITEDPCLPSAPAPPPLALPSWTTAARACADPSPRACPGSGVCAAPSPEGFSLCLRAAGDIACPEGFPDREVFFDALTDNRACAPCTCGLPSGARCTALVSLYADDACGVLLDAVTVASTGPVCVDLALPGAAPASAAVDEPVFEAGTCEPGGGEATGEVDPAGSTTFCCR